MKYIIIYFGLLFIGMTSCSTEFLEVKPNSNIVIPVSLEDCRRLLDNDGRSSGKGMNYNFPSMGQLASDEYYYDYSTWTSTVFAHERTCYIWAQDIYEGSNNPTDWEDAYHAIYIANVVIDVLDGIPVTESNKTEHDDLRGTALFFRAMWYHSLAEVFCMPYDVAAADQAMGLPLRDRPDVEEIKYRANLQDTYRFILEDLYASIPLLASDRPAEYRNRPSKSAAHALLARVALVMGDYELAEINATKSLELYDELLDFNDINLTGDEIFDRYNPEILLMTQIRGWASIATGQFARTTFVDSTLLDLYSANDLRREAFFTYTDEGKAQRKSLYTTSLSTFNCFNGLAVDEVVLIDAECKARKGDLAATTTVLNAFLRNRMDNQTFVPLEFDNQTAALDYVLDERRRELLFRGMRWSDIRRLNVEGRGIQMMRMLNGEHYVLEPNSIRYAFPIPQTELLISNIIQNPR